MKVLILDDDRDIRQLLILILQGMEYQVLEAGDIQSAIPHIAEADIAIVDVNLPDGDGYEFARIAKEKNPLLSIVMLTVRSAIEDVVKGYIDGADIYLAKPFSTAELTAILYSLSRRKQRLENVEELPHWRLNVYGRYLLSPDNQKADLTERETLFFEFLARSNRNLVSKREFVEAMGHNWLEYDNRRFDTFISRLKKRIREQLGQEIALKADRHGNYYLMEMIDLVSSSGAKPYTT